MLEWLCFMLQVSRIRREVLDYEIVVIIFLVFHIFNIFNRKKIIRCIVDVNFINIWHYF